MITEDKHFHFIAIGGVGMSALAKYLKERGAIVTGSDIAGSKYTDALIKLGIEVHIGHNKDYIKENSIIVASTAVKDDNPEIIKAKELKLKICHRSDILKMISDEFANKENATFIGFSGTHGKTTTSGLCSYIMEKAGFKPSYVVGGIIPELKTNGAYSSDKYFIAELDESDGTIQKYSTDIAVINNMEEDHLDHYINGFSDIAKTFNKYLYNNKKQTVIINNDNDGNKKFMNLYPEYKYITFGLNSANYTAKNIQQKGFGSSFEIYKNEKLIETLALSIPGLHNVYNALAVFAALYEKGIDTKALKEHFYTFSGMGRRFQKVAEFDNIKIFDDYAHHPSEIKTTLESAQKAKNETNRIVAVFQPHRYTRLKSLWKEFKNSFTDADKLFVLDVYSAGEDEIEGVNSEQFCNELNHNDFNYVQGDIDASAEKICSLIKKNDIIITLGAGSVTKLGKLIEDKYTRQSN